MRRTITTAAAAPLALALGACGESMTDERINIGGKGLPVVELTASQEDASGHFP